MKDFINKRKFPAYFLCAVLFAACSIQTNAQMYIDVLPDEVKGPFSERLDRIWSEVKTSDSGEWAGLYTRYLGETWSERLYWTPNHGFAAIRETCSSGPRIWVNFGSAQFRNGVIVLRSEQSGSGDFSLEVETELTPVKWGDQRWLVPTNQLELFANAVNSGSWQDYGAFFVRGSEQGENEDMPNEQPEIPERFKYILNREPLTAKVVEVGEKTDVWHPNLTIDIGRNEGVVVGMSFWSTGLSNTSVKISVVQVSENRAEARVTEVTEDYEYDDDHNVISEPEGFTPKPGLIFTNRSPQADKQ